MVDTDGLMRKRHFNNTTIRRYCQSYLGVATMQEVLTKICEVLSKLDNNELKKNALQIAYEFFMERTEVLSEYFEVTRIAYKITIIVRQYPVTDLGELFRIAYSYIEQPILVPA